MAAQQNIKPTRPMHTDALRGSEGGPAGPPLAQALLVYHESAHSIVFRDQLRRQQKAIRRTGAAPPPRPRVPPAVPEAPDPGYESGGSRGSTQSGRSGLSGGESLGSAASGGGRRPPPSRPAGAAGPRQGGPPAPSTVVVANFQPVIEPLERMELDSSNVFEPLLNADPDADLEMSGAELEVVELLKRERAVVKTIRNSDWTAFLQKFKPAEEGGSGEHEHHPAQRALTTSDATEEAKKCPFNSFVTSTSLLPACGKKMRCFGSTNEYAVGVVFALPSFPDDAAEDAAASQSMTWSWPSGYSAKTEFNINKHGNLINGREEALVPLSGIRKMNHDYLHEKNYVVGGRMVKGGLSVVPYNEIYVRVGGPGRISGGADVVTGDKRDDADGSGRSFDRGIGLPVALFVREADYGHLVRLLRTRARYAAVFGPAAGAGIPLLFLVPDRGVRVFTEALQRQVLKKMCNELNPFQNPSLAHKTGFDSTDDAHFQQKLEELLDLDDESVRQVLTPEEKARIAGGFGATDESVANLLNEAISCDMPEEADRQRGGAGPNLQDLVNEGLAFSLRANDYHTSRQMLILYTLVAAKQHNKLGVETLIEATEGRIPDVKNVDAEKQTGEKQPAGPPAPLGANEAKPSHRRSSSSKDWKDVEKHVGQRSSEEIQAFREERTVLGEPYVPPPPPPPPLDTDRLRSATNSDGLLAVLGAAQVLRVMRDESAKRRVKEAIDAIEEWVENGEQSVAFRVASWREQRAAQGDLKIAMENDSNFMAFISNKAISNRKKFAKQLRDATEVTEFDSLQFLKSIHSVCAAMNSPCLRLELLQYILGLDNRYSVAHVTRSVELAATCLNLSENDALGGDIKKLLK